jgi:hypothetical protein
MSMDIRAAKKILSIVAVQSQYTAAPLVFYCVPLYVQNEDTTKSLITQAVFITSSKYDKIFQVKCAVS